MDQLEESLRDTFRRRVAATPAVGPLADRAIAGARRRRATGAAVAAVVCLALAGGIVASSRDTPTAEPIAPPSEGAPPSQSFTVPPIIPGLPIEVVAGNYLLFPNGGVVSLHEAAPITAVWRVPGAWLVQSGLDPYVLRYWPEFKGQITELVRGTSIVVSPATASRPSIQIAWTDDTRLRLGTYAGGTVTETASTPLPVSQGRPLSPQAIAGDAVVLAGTQTGGGLDIWDVWRPGDGDYAATPHPTIGLSATTVDGERLIAWREGCVGELDPVDFTPVRSVCPSPILDYDRVFPSPDGRWWMAIGGSGAVLYDTEEVWDGALPARVWPEAMMFFDGAPAVWLDATSFVVRNRSGDIVTLHTDGRPDDVATIPPYPWEPGLVAVVDLR